MSKKLNPHCLVLVGSMIGFERDFTIKLRKIVVQVLNTCMFSADRQQIYSSDSEEGYDSGVEESGAKRLMKAKKVISDDEVRI